MAIIPLKQRVTIRRKVAVNEWGESEGVVEVVIKARVDETMSLVTNPQGEEVSSSATIYIDKLANVRYDDVLIFINELGFVTEESPKSIVPKRGMSGKSLITVVSV